MTNSAPAEAFPPGDFIREEMEARGWRQVDLVEILGKDSRAVHELLHGKRAISPEMAEILANAFGTSAQLWMNLETSWQLFKGRGKGSDPAVARRAKLYSLAPVKEMVSRGWIEGSRNVDILEAQVLQFHEAKSLEVPFGLPHAAKKSTLYSEETPAQVTWVYRARQLARALQAPPYSESRLKEALERLTPLKANPEDSRQVPRVLLECGVRFVVVERLDGSKIDGATFWIDAKSPVIAMSLRFDRIDNFWFVLLHEIGHIHRRDASIDSDLIAAASQSKDRPETEVEADRFAQENIVPQQELRDFCARTRPLYAMSKIVNFSARIGVHPGIVVGQLQHRNEINFNHSRSLLAKVRESVISSALTDGWGHVPQV